MRFKKGSQVEIFKSEVPSGAWWCAVIISGNGHNYTVEYARYSGKTNETAQERVSRKEIRPCPPPVQRVTSWMAGDLVEVLDDFSWKIATVLKVLGGECYSVRLLGSSREFQTHKSNIRVRQSWQDDKWVVIGKVKFAPSFITSFVLLLFFSMFLYLSFLWWGNSFENTLMGSSTVFHLSFLIVSIFCLTELSSSSLSFIVISWPWNF